MIFSGLSGVIADSVIIHRFKGIYRFQAGDFYRSRILFPFLYEIQYNNFIKNPYIKL